MLYGILPFEFLLRHIIPYPSLFHNQFSYGNGKAAVQMRFCISRNLAQKRDTRRYLSINPCHSVSKWYKNGTISKFWYRKHASIPQKHWVLLIQTLHRRKQQNIPNRRRIRHHHHHPVNSEPNSAGRRHADAQCIQEIFVGMVRLCVPGSQQRFLCLKTFLLIDGIIQLGISIGHFPTVHKEFKTFHILRIVRFLFG